MLVAWKTKNGKLDVTIAIAETNQCFVKQTQAARKKNNDDKYEFIWSLVFA